MKVGDLVKIYSFTRKARESGLLSEDTNVDAHIIGLIVKGGSIEYGHYRRVLRCCDGENDLYNVARLEVINASR
jgi:hypothetical protein